MKPEWTEQAESPSFRRICMKLAGGSVSVNEECGGAWLGASVTQQLPCDVDAAKDQAFGILLPKLEAMVADMRRMMDDAQESPEVVAETEAGGKL